MAALSIPAQAKDIEPTVLAMCVTRDGMERLVEAITEAEKWDDAREAVSTVACRALRPTILASTVADRYDLRGVSGPHVDPSNDLFFIYEGTYRGTTPTVPKTVYLVVYVTQGDASA